ncbi:unnamed protein product [Adineta ricciae]|uniref:Uncharacterized protein n=1 Tax=Adineta ricciae TaxID=249248 RepID=A0A814GWB9_ADIRI|nr:unnamed protein product [Adineta ricciae]
MNNSTELLQLYVLLSYEKLRRSKISQHHRPTEASLRDRLLVWRFLKQIENESITRQPSEQESFSNDSTDNNTDDLTNSNSWILDLDANCADDMDIESDLLNIVDNNQLDSNVSPCETMNIDQTSDVNILLKRTIGAERRQKVSSDNFHFNETTAINENLQSMSEGNIFEETEQFFQELCAELTNTTATLVSTSAPNALNFPPTPEQALIH